MSIFQAHKKSPMWTNFASGAFSRTLKHAVQAKIRTPRSSMHIPRILLEANPRTIRRNAAPDWRRGPGTFSSRAISAVYREEIKTNKRLRPAGDMYRYCWQEQCSCHRRVLLRFGLVKIDDKRRQLRSSTATGLERLSVATEREGRAYASSTSLSS